MLLFQIELLTKFRSRIGKGDGPGAKLEEHRPLETELVASDIWPVSPVEYGLKEKKIIMGNCKIPKSMTSLDQI